MNDILSYLYGADCVCDGVIAAGMPHLIQADRYDRRLYA